MNAWVLLAAAITLEVIATSFLKMSDGFAKPLWGGLSILFYTMCFWCLAPVLKVIPVGVTYAIWSGVGIAAITLIGLVVFKQTLSVSQFGFIAMIAVGAIGLNLTTQA